MNIDSPFEQWRLKHMKGIAASRDIMELLALAFEGGRVAERELCAKLCDLFAKSSANVPSRYEFMGESAQECANLVRARGNHEQD